MELGLGSVAVKQRGRAQNRRPGLELGFHLPCRGPHARVDVVSRLARTADTLGYSVLTISDHIVLPTHASAPYPYDNSGAFPGGAQQPFIEPIPLAAWLLAITRRIRVAISVLVVPYRNPVVTAKQLATIDAMSGGRLIVGVGVGWWPEEFEAVAAPPFAERGAVTDEYIRLMKTLWTEDDPRHEGKYYRVSDVTLLPKPVSKPHPPIWVGGHTEPALRRTALLGDAWHPIGLRGPAGLAPQELGHKMERIRTLAREGGRDPAAIRVAFRAPLDLWPARGKAPVEAARPLAGPAGKVVTDLRAYQAAGVDTMVFDFPQPEPAAMVTLMRRVAREVRPQLARPVRRAATRSR
jgi:probable F420-dependent oxidoreductase